MSEPWKEAQLEFAARGALILFGPGARDLLPTGTIRRHVPPGTLVPLAEGARLANPRRPVVAIGGDGDLYGGCLGALLHAARRNTGITCIVDDNGVAAGGSQASVTGIRPAELARAAGATFVAETKADQSLPEVARDALQHPGFSLVIVDGGKRPATETGVREHRPALENLLAIGQVAPISAICTVDESVWEWLLYGDDDEPGEEEDPE